MGPSSDGGTGPGRSAVPPASVSRILLVLLSLLFVLSPLVRFPPVVTGGASGQERSGTTPLPGASVAQGYRVLQGRRVSVYYSTDDSIRADRTLRFLEGQTPLPGLPDTLPTAVEVFLAPDPGSMESLAGGRVPEWGAGLTVPRLDRIVMPAYGGRNTRGRSEQRVLRHEWAHVGLNQYLDGLRSPRWFDEGYAEWASGGWNAEEGWRLRVALATAGPSLDSLTLRWPRDRSSAELAYMLSGTAVEYLVRRSGARGMRLFLERWKSAGSFEDAFRRVFGVTTAQFEEDWREYVSDRYGWLFVLSHSVVFWLFLGAALTVMFWIRRRRNREAMARLRATEPPETPDWWRAPEEPGAPGRVPNDIPPS